MRTARTLMSNVEAFETPNSSVTPDGADIELILYR